MLRYRIREGRGQLLEIMPEPDVERLAETLVAFANADGGDIVIGLDERGRPAGYILPEEVEGVLRRALEQTHPMVQTEWHQEQVDGHTIVLVHVPRSVMLHSLADGRVLIRSRDENKVVSGDDLTYLSIARSTKDFEAETVPGATIADFDPDIVDEYREKWEERQRRSWLGTTEELLLAAGAVDMDKTPTVAGILLFGKEPQFYLPQAEVDFVRFLGVEPRGPEGLPGYGRRERIRGPLARQVERAWEVVQQEMRVEAVVRGLQREERPEYPPFPVREALVNAVAHRDYRIRGSRIEVRMFDDRLEVKSPGGLPPPITLDNIVEEHYSRNPRIVNGLYQWGYIEELGLGIDRMIDDMLAYGHPRPEFKASPHAFTVILRNRRERVAPPSRRDWGVPLNPRQLKALQYLERHGRITNREYQELCPEVSAETLRLDLADMVKKGLILKVGHKRGTYYILK